MGYIHTVSIDGGSNYLIEPNLFATAGGTSLALTAAITDFTLFSGAYVIIKVGQVGANATLNVNNTGNKPIYYNGVRISADLLSADNIYGFVYDGTNWNVIGDATNQDIMIGTKAEWQVRYAYTAPRGTILIYTDNGSYEDENENTIVVPAIKIADGSTPCADLPFVGDDIKAEIMRQLQAHITDNVRHITAAERTFWNNKINCVDAVSENNLILNRN